MEDIYEAVYGGKLPGFVVSKIGCDLAQDALQDIFLETAKTERSKIRDLPKFVNGVASQVIKGYIARLIGDRNRFYVPRDDQQAKEPSVRDSSELVIARITNSELLKNLTEREREVLTRFYLREQPAQQISVAMGFPSVNALNTARLRALKKSRIQRKPNECQSTPNLKRNRRRRRNFRTSSGRNRSLPLVSRTSIYPMALHGSHEEANQLQISLLEEEFKKLGISID